MGARGREDLKLAALSARTDGYIGAALVAIIVAACTAAVPPTATPGSTAMTAPPATAMTTPQRPTYTATPVSVPPQTAAPTAAASSIQTPSLIPSGAPTASAPTPAAFEATVSRHLDALAAIAAQNDGIRAAGTSGYDASADYVAAELAALGLEVSREPVDFTFFNEAAPVALSVGSESWIGGEWLHANLYSGEGDLSAVVEAVGIRNGEPTETAGCDPSDWVDFNDGNVALVMTGGCLALDKVLQAQGQGAVALVTMVPTWDEPNETLRPTLLDPTLIEIPAIVTGADPIDELLAAAGARDEITLTVNVVEEPATDDNVFGDLAGDSEVVMLGGHLDSVLDGPGVNDNGSGVATLLAIAEALQTQSAPRRTVRFVFWAAEEFGTLGSADYVRNLPARDLERVTAYLNLDMVGSPNAGYYVYDDDADPVSRGITDSIMSALADAGLSGAGIPSGGSDHVAFWQAGVPIGGVFSGIGPLTPDDAERFGGIAGEAADPCYHRACDGRANVDTATATDFGRAILAVVEELAY